MSPTSTLRRGFTLIELLVVISIIALLIGILLPALGAARNTARDAQCLSNQRQIATASYAYASDYNGMLVPMATMEDPRAAQALQEPSLPGIWDTNPDYEPSQFFTSTLVDEYGLTQEFYQCPSFDNREEGAGVITNAPLDDLANFRWRNSDYGANSFVHGRLYTVEVPGFGDSLWRDFNSPARVEDVLKPSSVFSIGEMVLLTGLPSSSFYSGGGVDLYGTLYMNGNYAPGGTSSPHARHGGNGSTNMAFVDGHAESLRIADQDNWNESIPDRDADVNSWTLDNKPAL